MYVVLLGKACLSLARQYSHYSHFEVLLGCFILSPSRVCKPSVLTSLFVLHMCALYFHTKRYMCMCNLITGGICVADAGITFEGKVQLLAFCVFEACVGLFWPSMMKMRSQYVPEESRSTIINFFRIPLNMFVCIMLYNVSP